MSCHYPKRLLPLIQQGWFDSRHPELIQRRQILKKICAAYQSSPTPGHLKQLKSCLGQVGEKVFIEPGFFCEYGEGIELGHQVYLNLNVLLLDAAYIRIGSYTLVGPNVQIVSIGHQRDPVLRRQGLTETQPVNIGSNVWIGAGAIILPGVTIGENAIIGAGAVVTKSVPVGETWVGNPAKKK
jgi:maltose O-acetyltransferase